MTIYVAWDCILEQSIDIYHCGNIHNNILKVMLVIIWVKVHCETYWLFYWFGVRMRWIRSMSVYIEHMAPWMYIRVFFFWSLQILGLDCYLYASLLNMYRRGGWITVTKSVYIVVVPKLKLYVLDRSQNMLIIQSYIEDEIYALYVQQVYNMLKINFSRL